MRCQEVRAVRMIAIMKSLGVKSAEDCSIEDACRLYSRVQRGSFRIGQVAMGPQQLQEKGRQRRRARQTHRGKR